MALDVGSLEGDGPARIQVLCPDLELLHGLILPFYFGTTGRRLTFELDLEDLEGMEGRLLPRAGEGGGGDGEGSSSEEGRWGLLFFRGVPLRRGGRPKCSAPVYIFRPGQLCCPPLKRILRSMGEYINFYF